MNDVMMVLPFKASSELIQWTRDAYRDVRELDIVGVDGGKDPVIGYSDIEFNVPGILNRLMLAEKQGYRAAIIGCFGDPGLLAARQVCSIPVIGPGESALAVASTLGDRIMVFVPGKEFVYPTEKNIVSYGYRDKVVDVRIIDMPLETLTAVPEEEIRKTAEMCFRAVADTRTHVIVLGCIGFCGFSKPISLFFEDQGIRCPIVEPGITAIEYAQLLVRLGLNQSRMMF